MGIPGPGQSLEGSQSTFSDDLLSIELCGPEQQNLSIIDIPGIFRTPTEGVTTKEDMALVRRIMYHHIRDERTIILAVVPSNTDIATQEILTIAKEVDPKGLRTLGVLTKPDLIDDGGQENVMMLVEGKRNPLRLGYHIVRNGGQSELSSQPSERARKEKEFFLSQPWSRLNRDRVGTQALQQRLQDLLVDITRREFPKVQSQILKKLADCRRQIEGLGVERQSPEQQRRYLLKLSNGFQKMADSALDAYYSREKAFSNHDQLRLATLAADRMDQFSEDVERLGHTVKFDLPGNEVKATETLDESSSLSVNGSGDMLNSLNDRSDATVALYPELEEFTISGKTFPEPSNRSILDWIREEHRRARSFGLATIGPSTLPTIWQEQTKNWENLTMDYIGDLVYYVHDFIYNALTHVCEDERVRTILWSVLQEDLVKKYKETFKHVKFILHVERFGKLLTSNHDYNDNLEVCKTSRLKGMLEGHAITQDDSAGLIRSTKVVNMDRVTQSTTMDSNDRAVHEIHDILVSYYEIARKRFVDTVCMQGSDFYLLTGESSPLRLFSTNFVSNLSPNQLDMIAGEEAATRQLRESLTNQIDALEKGKKILRV